MARETLTTFPFEVLQKLGEGGMGVVYKARQTNLDRFVALKMIRSGIHADSQELARFHTEADAIAHLRHPNIVQIFEVGEHDGLPYLSLEFCDGGSLEDRLKRGPLPAREAAELVETLARAMQTAHAQGIIHRDLKPANVLFAACGLASTAKPQAAQLIPKITDFGLAKNLGQTGQTESGAILGTPSYMAPEQASASREQLGPSTDVYALGAILYECLTGQPPFTGPTAMETLMQVMTDDPVPPSQFSTKTPRDLETVCLRCLHKDPAKRYRNAEALAEDLRRFLKGEPILARRINFIERTLKWAARRPGTATAVIASVLIVSAVGVASAVGFAWKNAENQKQRAEEQQQRAEQFRNEAERLSTLLTVRNGVTLSEEGEAGRGVLWMARSLAMCPESARTVQESIRSALPSAVATLHTLERVYVTKTPIILASFSPDGKTLLIGGQNVYLLDVATGKQLGDVQVSGGEISGGGFSPDGKRFVTSTMKGLVRVADSASTKDVAPPINHNGTVKSAVFSPDGKTLLVAAQFGSTLQRYAVDTHRPVGPTFSLLEKLLPLTASVAGLGGSSFGYGPLLAAATLTPGRTYSDNLYMAIYNKDGSRVATAAMERVARVFDTRTGLPIGRPLMHPGVVFSVAFSPDGKTLATGCLDDGVRFWDIESGQPAGPTLHHKGPVRSTNFSHDGRLILTSSEDGAARLWDVKTGLPVGQLLSHPSEMRHAIFSPDETHILTAGFEGTGRLWRMAQEQARVIHNPGAVALIAFSPDGKRVLTGCQESVERPGESRLWDAITGEACGPPLPQNGQVMAIAFSPDGKLVLTGGNDRTVKLWNAADGSSFQAPWQYGNVVAAIAFSPDGQRVAIGGRDGLVQLRELATGKILASWQAYDRKGLWVWTLAFTPDGQRLLSGGGLEGRLWNVGDGAPLGTPIGQPMQHSSEARFAILSPDGEMVLTCSYDQTSRVWSARDGHPLTPPLEHKGQVRTGAFRPDGKAVATAGADGTVRLWEIPSGRSLMPPLLHDGWVRSVAFSPDGKTLATGCDDGSTRLWSAEDGAPRGAVLKHRAPVNQVAFAADGKTVLTASSDGTARLWTLPAPVRGTPELVTLWVQVLTGMELDAEGTVQVLPGDVWQQRQKQLQERGGPPTE